MEGILSIQSHVVFGHVGNSAAVFALQRSGFEVWPVMTVLFSNHTGYGPPRGRAVPVDWLREILHGLEERGVFGRTRAVLSGYLGDPATAEVVIEAVERVRRHRPDAVYACDPVIGDDGRGVFVRAGIPELLRDRLVPLATLVKPNRFELSFLAGMEVRSLEDALEAAARIRAHGPELVVVTSLASPERQDALAVLADTALGSWIVVTPRLPCALNGTGDLFAALLLGNWLVERDPERALSRTASAVFGLVEATFRARSRELLLIAAQRELVEPTHRFTARRLR
ncbi:MAG: pyridoxal kinase PdxY [Geminicoccaceae bacterium]|nr:pyridoxal kinase PdxY [Geminicoccaceae bacterium]